jgi:uncharacterized Fe-S cluster-containing radical SAM superfamily enzyme
MKVTRNESVTAGSKPIAPAPHITGVTEKREVSHAYVEGDAVRVDVVFEHALIQIVDSAKDEQDGEKADNDGKSNDSGSNCK